MNKDEIYKQLKDKGLNFSMIAESLDVSKQAVHRVISNGKGSKRIATAIAEVCDCSLEDIFPFYAKRMEEKSLRKQQQIALNERLKKLKQV